MRFYTTAKLGPNRELLPNGFTLFRNVSVARTGVQIYGPGEISIAPGPDGFIHVDRNPDQVFRRETLDSLNGATYVIDHPEDDVGPDNWQQLAHGVFLNSRRGTGEQVDEMVADLIVTTAYGLSVIDAGKREISLGYDADYFETGAGRGEQRNIIINHGASVDAGRCGSRCAVKDHAPKGPGAYQMKKTIKDRIRDAFKAKDEESMNKALEEVKDEEHEYSKDCDCKDCKSSKYRKAKDSENEERFKKIEDSLGKVLDAVKARDKKSKDEEEEEEKKKKEAADKARDAAAEEEKKKTEDDESELEEEAPEGTGDAARKARDSAYLVDSFENTKMLAEIIAPGVKVPTFDRAADPKKTFVDCICALRRKALQMGTNDAATSAIIDTVRGRTTDSAVFDKMPCGQVRTIFASVGALKKQANNAAVTSAGVATKDTQTLSPIQQFVANSNKRHGIK
jgi:hypothetical protein